MLSKLILSCIIFSSFSYAAYQEVRIGKIDNFYKNKITKKQLRTIINEIENTFESQLGMNVFDYSKNGKAIDIVYVEPSKLEKRITRKLQSQEFKKKKIDKFKSSLPKKNKEIDYLQTKFNETSKVVNKKIKVFNDYVYKVNERKTLPKDEYLAVQSYVKSENKKLNKEISKLKKEQKRLKRIINKFNKDVKSNNRLVSQYNRVNKEIESMNRNFKKVKGVTFSTKEITSKTYFKDGKKYEEKTVKNHLDKIEIYGFDNHGELKAIIAHEIAHLLGIPHIESKNALLNPMLQKNQERELSLTKDDIENFIRHF